MGAGDPHSSCWLSWAGDLVLSAVAWVAILYWPYPRGIFEFNVGVLRWTWRVQYYAMARSAPISTRRSRWPMTRPIRPGSRSSTPGGCPAG